MPIKTVRVTAALSLCLLAAGSSAVAAQTVPVVHLRSITTESVGAGDFGAGELGYSVDLSGQVLVAGAPAYTEFLTGGTDTIAVAGAVFAFDVETGSLLSRVGLGSNVGVFQPLGRRVAVDGLRALGSRVSDCCANPPGAPALSWLIDQPEPLRALPQPVSTDGNSVAVRGETLAIGSINDNRFLTPPQSVGGAVRVYDADSGTELRVLGPDDPGPGRAFGTALAITDDFILVGAGNLSGSGDVYVFDRDSGEQLRRIRPTSPRPGAFGITLDAEGDVFIAGSLASPAGSGRAYVYDARSGQQLRVLQHPTPASNDAFARGAVGLSLPYAVVPCRQCSVDRVADGAVFVFNVDSGELVATLSSPDPRDNGLFGHSVAIDGEIIAVGEPSVGAVHLYRIGPRIFSSGFE